MAIADEKSATNEVLASCFHEKLETEFDKKLCELALANSTKLNDLYFSNLQDRLSSQRLRIHYQDINNNISARIIERQLILNPIILMAVLILVFFGAYLSYLQVKKDLLPQSNKKIKNYTNSQDKKDYINEEADPVIHSFELGKEGLKVRSSVVGLMILVVSLVFFYLYLTNVYKIELANVKDEAKKTEHTEQRN